MVKVKVHGLTTDPQTKRQILWLQSTEDNVVLPIVIGGTEAVSIYSELAHKPPPRPLTHDLIQSILKQFDARVSSVSIIDLKDGTFYAELLLDSQSRELRLDARPSDGIALALKYDAPIFLAENVLSQAGYAIRKTGPEGILYVEPLNQDEPAIISDEAVKSAVEDLIEETGRHTSAAPTPQNPQQRLETLTQKMKTAIQREAYEEAGRIQKQIERLKKEQKSE